MEDSCALDLAEAGPLPREKTAEALGMTGERARQIEVKAVGRLHATAARVPRRRKA